MIAEGFTCQRYGFNVGADKFSLLTIENGKTSIMRLSEWTLISQSQKSHSDRLLDPDSAETCYVVHCGKILAEDKNSFIINHGDSNATYVMKFPELYTLFRIVDDGDEVTAICEMIDNYARDLFDKVDNEWPFDVNFLDKMEDSIYDCGNVPVERQNAVMEKLKQTKFKSFSEQIRSY